MGLFDRFRGGDGERVAVLGIDGVPHSLVEDSPDRFPTLSSMRGAPIDSVYPPESSACWPALTTGVTPGKTGVYGFQERADESYETYVPTGNDVRTPRLWDRVEAAGRRATVLNVPVTYPAQENVHRMVSGFLSPDIEAATTDAETAQFLTSIGYEIDADAKLGHQEDKSAFIENANETLDARYEAFSHYLDEDDWDLFFGVFMTTDRVNHFLYGDYAADGEYKEEFLDFYENVDACIGRLRDQLPDDVTLLVVSDHGFQAERGEADLNAWLQREGWLDYDTSAPEGLSDISDDTRAYSLIPGRLYLNLEDREPRGRVPESEYDDARAELADALESLRDPDGEPVVDRVVTREDAFHGAATGTAPDLIAIPANGYDLKAGFGGDDVFSTSPRNGMHSFSDAVLFTDDPSIDPRDATDLLDITPTVLDTLGVEYAHREFDGTSIH